MGTWDVAVIGGGPAGLSAAADLASGGLSCLVIDRMGCGGELMNLGVLDDVDGSPTGPDFGAQLMETAMTAGAESVVAEVTGLMQTGTQWRIETDDDWHIAHAVILATGLAPGSLGVEHEASFEGQGLSHCANCDGPLYQGEPVAVAGSDRWALAEARDLVAMGCQVTLITDSTDAHADGATVLPGKIVALEGSDGLSAVLVQPPGADDPLRVPMRALFVQTGRQPALDFAPASLGRDIQGRLTTDGALGCTLPGLYAAGDVRAGAVRSVAEAINDGKRAAATVRAALGSLGNEVR